jgi:hypothetical protein
MVKINRKSYRQIKLKTNKTDRDPQRNEKENV